MLALWLHSLSQTWWVPTRRSGVAAEETVPSLHHGGDGKCFPRKKLQSDLSLFLLKYKPTDVSQVKDTSKWEISPGQESSSANPSNDLTISTQKKTFDQIFREFIFEIPHYQRRYCWTWENIKQLLEDFAKVGLKSNHFMGSVVLAKKPDSYVHYVIDGQQCLTTMTIIFSVLQLLAEKKKEDETLQNISKLCRTYTKQERDGINFLEEFPQGE
jgi:hypothetical protein